MIEDGLRTYITAQSTITAYIGTDVKRISSMVAPQDYVFPFLVVTRNSTDPVHSMSGDTGQVTAELSIDIYALTSKKVFQIADAIRLKMDGYRGLMGTDFVGHCFMRGWAPQWIAPSAGDEFGVYSGSMDFTILYEQTAASF